MTDEVDLDSNDVRDYGERDTWFPICAGRHLVQLKSYTMTPSKKANKRFLIAKVIVKDAGCEGPIVDNTYAIMLDMPDGNVKADGIRAGIIRQFVCAVNGKSTKDKEFKATEAQGKLLLASKQEGFKGGLFFANSSVREYTQMQDGVSVQKKANNFTFDLAEQAA